MLRASCFGFLLLLASPLLAVEEVQLNNLEDEPRFLQLSYELRCMVCQNQSIADSNAELARDFRNQVKEKINQGQTNDEIVEYMVDRYGDYILYRPPFNAATLVLWLGPFVLMIAGLWMVLRLRRQQVVEQPEKDLVGKQSQLDELLAQSPDVDEDSGDRP